MIILALGSNLSSKHGDRVKNIDTAIKFLETYGIKILKRSNYYETPSYPDKSKPKFINIIVSTETSLLATDLASILLFVEEKLGRVRKNKNEPRTCDIDIIDYNNQVMDFKYLDYTFTVPHAKLTHRNFVLIPLKEIIPNWIHPKTKQTINELIEKLSNEDKKSILKITKN